jgi:hypothetical protein
VTDSPTTDRLLDDVTEVDVATAPMTVTDWLAALVALHPDRTATTT